MTETVAEPEALEQPGADHILDVVDLTKSFGGIQAVQHLDVYVGTGSITAMIGPNGAGKTTVFNLISGLYKPDQGRIIFEGRDIGGLTPDRVQKRGVARTFQNQRLFANLPVLDNVLVGYHSRLKAGLFGDIIKPPWVRKEEKEARQKAFDTLRLFGRRLAPFAQRRAIDLPYADRRLLEVARAIVSGPRLLMLDEPTAGMNPSEIVTFMEYIHVIREVVPTILLIEHNLNVVMGVSERVFVLDYGTKIAEGTPQEVRENDAVIEAYIGRKATTG